ncbi:MULTISPECIES: DNA repair protein RadC [unclassified Granulicatella]|uniref:RadC family protein n=1 Tax=unclassified Granulicatella TaxID=2630493 RepID=UPI001073FE27|nr:MULTISPECIES: DNA repair protein RadC [unclassified Granulicatella]MBF0780052.1 DNA repair protein RadC [Granulicatella sp. 19428wC4_WM01]TFU95839.1 JAB domain-containing protein [Granulicatella sp. WM01]
MLIKDIHKDAKPRERLLKYGADYLSEHELLAILVRTGGCKNNSALDLANAILQKFENLYNLTQVTPQELMTINGIGQAKAIELVATIELGKRMMLTKQEKHGQITSSQIAGKIFMHELQFLHQEHVLVVYLNTKNELIKKKTIFIGSANKSVAEPRDIFREAIKLGSVKLIIGHNHPSGNPKPSKEDILFTKRMIEAGELIGIDVLDHFIVGDKTYISLKELSLI